MAVFPNYYQMAVQFTVDPPIPEMKQSAQEKIIEQEELKDNFVTPATNGKVRNN